jgi:hypothetical protein
LSRLIVGEKKQLHSFNSGSAKSDNGNKSEDEKLNDSNGFEDQPNTEEERKTIGAINTGGVRILLQKY